MMNQNNDVVRAPTDDEWDAFYCHMCDPSGDEVVIMDNGTILVSENVNVECLIADLATIGITVSAGQVLRCG